MSLKEQAAKESAEIMQALTRESAEIFLRLKEKGKEAAKESSQRLRALTKNIKDKVANDSAEMAQTLRERGRGISESLQTEMAKANITTDTLYTNFGGMLIL